MESILTSIKKMLGIVEDYEHFDPEIIMHINSVLMIMTQLGVGPSEGFFIKDKFDIWSDFLPNLRSYEGVKSYVYLKVKLLFDPPSSSIVLNSMTDMAKELEWRLNVIAEQPADILKKGV